MGCILKLPPNYSSHYCCYCYDETVNVQVGGDAADEWQEGEKKMVTERIQFSRYSSLSLFYPNLQLSNEV